MFPDGYYSDFESQAFDIFVYSVGKNEEIRQAKENNSRNKR